jgi:hypothetical protein
MLDRVPDAAQVNRSRTAQPVRTRQKRAQDGPLRIRQFASTSGRHALVPWAGAFGPGHRDLRSAVQSNRITTCRIHSTQFRSASKRTSTTWSIRRSRHCACGGYQDRTSSLISDHDRGAVAPAKRRQCVMAWTLSRRERMAHRTRPTSAGCSIAHGSASEPSSGPGSSDRAAVPRRELLQVRRLLAHFEGTNATRPHPLGVRPWSVDRDAPDEPPTIRNASGSRPGPFSVSEQVLAFIPRRSDAGCGGVFRGRRRSRRS